MPIHDAVTLFAPSTPQEQLQARLADPQTVDSLNRLLDRVDLISASVEMLDGFLRRGDDIADNVSSSFDEVRGMVDSDAMGLIEKLPQMARAGSKMADVANSSSVDRLLASGLLEKLAQPETIEGLTLLLSKLDLIVLAVKSVDEFLRRGDEIADNITESVGDLHTLASSGEVQRFTADLPQLAEAGHQLVQSGLLSKLPEFAEIGTKLTQSGLLEPAMMQSLGEVGKAAAESYEAAKTAPQKKYGVFDLLHLLKDPAVQRSLNIGVETARQFGAKVK